MRIIRYLKNCKVAVLLIVCLLVVQAFTDLALPHYTSDIVDVGIQQSGVEHAATDEMTAKTHDEIAMMLPVDDEQTFRDAYTETDDGTYKLNDQGKKEQEELDRMVALPLVAIHYSSQIPDLDLDQVMQAYEAGAIDKQKILDMLDEAKQHMGDMGDSIVDQQAIAAAKGFINATDCADYLTKKGMPFRDAYKLTGCMVSDCIAKDKTLEELTLDEFKGYSALFENDIYDAIDLVKCCEGRTSYGGPSEASVNNQIALANAQLDAWEEKNA